MTNYLTCSTHSTAYRISIPVHLIIDGNFGSEMSSVEFRRDLFFLLLKMSFRTHFHTDFSDAAHYIDLYAIIADLRGPNDVRLHLLAALKSPLLANVAHAITHHLFADLFCTGFYPMWKWVEAALHSMLIIGKCANPNTGFTRNGPLFADSTIGCSEP